MSKKFQSFIWFVISSTWWCNKCESVRASVYWKLGYIWPAKKRKNKNNKDVCIASRHWPLDWLVAARLAEACSSRPCATCDLPFVCRSDANSDLPPENALRIRRVAFFPPLFVLPRFGRDEFWFVQLPDRVALERVESARRPLSSLVRTWLAARRGTRKSRLFKLFSSHVLFARLTVADELFLLLLFDCPAGWWFAMTQRIGQLFVHLGVFLQVASETLPVVVKLLLQLLDAGVIRLRWLMLLVVAAALWRCIDAFFLLYLSFALMRCTTVYSRRLKSFICSRVSWIGASSCPLRLACLLQLNWSAAVSRSRFFSSWSETNVRITSCCCCSCYCCVETNCDADVDLSISSNLKTLWQIVFFLLRYFSSFSNLTKLRVQRDVNRNTKSSASWVDLLINWATPHENNVEDRPIWFELNLKYN